MSERVRRRPFNRRTVVVIALLALCVVAADAVGLAEPIVASVQWNTSPPLKATIDGVTLSAAHSRYLTIDSITLTLTNQSPAPVYLPIMTQFRIPKGEYDSVGLAPTDYGCSPIETEVQGAQGWQSLGSGCVPEWRCPSGMPPPFPTPAVLVIRPGETAVFPLYDGQAVYPPLLPGAYRFRVLFSHTPFQAAQPFSLTLRIPNVVVLVSNPVTLTSAWWIPPWYHHVQLPCPMVS